MSDKPLYEFHNRDSFFYILVIFVSVVMESDKVAVVFVNPGCGDDGTPEIAANIFDGCFGVAFVGLCIYVKTFLMLLITAGFNFLKEGPIRASISLSRAVRKALRRKV